MPCTQKPNSVSEVYKMFDCADISAISHRRWHQCSEEVLMILPSETNGRIYILGECRNLLFIVYANSIHRCAWRLFFLVFFCVFAKHGKEKESMMMKT
jgi:hypothetical protein